MSLLEIRDLSVTYRSREGPVRAVQDVSLSLDRGQALGLVGESGCGKSTLAKAILGILPERTEERGSVIFDGVDLAKADDETMRKYRGRNISLIFQDPMTRLDPLMTIRRHFLEVIEAHEPRTSREEAEERVRRVLKAVRIPAARMDQYPHEFSGGMRQRIMIALGLIFNPSLLIADEPTTSLDVIVEAQILELLRTIRAEFNTALLIITHNLGLVAEYADDMAVMYAGHVVEQGTVLNVFAKPLHPYTQGLLESVIDLNTTTLKYIQGHPPDLLHPPSGCPFHPRCPSVMPQCSGAFPPLTRPDPGRTVACYLYP